jgi:hypothetical protein
MHTPSYVHASAALVVLRWLFHHSTQKCVRAHIPEHSRNLVTHIFLHHDYGVQKRPDTSDFSIDSRIVLCERFQVGAREFKPHGFVTFDGLLEDVFTPPHRITSLYNSEGNPTVD